jgi:hypothetical protein
LGRLYLELIKTKNKPSILSIKPYFASKIFPLLSFQLSSFALPWLATIWFTYKQDLNEAGEFTFALAFISPLCMLLATPSRNFILTNTNALTYAFRARLLLIFIGLLTLAIVGGYFGVLLFFSALFLFKITELLFDLPISVAVHRDDLAALWKLSFYKWVVIMLLVILAFFVNHIEWLFAICALCFFVLIFFQTAAKNKKGTNKQLISLIKSSLPLGFSALVFSLHFNIPRYVIGGSEQKELLAIYSISSFLVMGAVVLVNVFIQAKLPSLKIMMETQSQKFKRELVKITFFMGVVFLAIQVAHFSFFSQIFWAVHNNVQQGNEGYLALYHQIIYLAWGPVVFSAINYFLMLTGQHKTLLLITLANIVFTYVVCVLAQSYGGIVWLVWAYNLSSIFQFVAVIAAFKLARQNR